MIQDQDRRRWIGASDTSYVVGNWKTESFYKWWKQKVGMDLLEPKWWNDYTLAGTYYEHAILDAISPNMVADEQILLPELNLRVNLDGTLYKGEQIIIHEVKTHKESSRTWKVTKDYWRQAQIEMFARRTTKLVIVEYPLTDEHYDNWFLPIEAGKIVKHPVEYDGMWVGREYLPKLKYISDCIHRGHYPQEDEFEAIFKRKGKGVQNPQKGKARCLHKG